MFSRIERTRRSNHSIFLPQNFGSPFNDTAEHISGLGLARIDFERCVVVGEVIYSVEGDSTPTSQQNDEARIATLAHALKKLGNPEDAAEFMRCLNAICEEGDARYRQVAASYYYGEIAERGAGPVLKEMALIAMHLASLNPVTEELESDSEIAYDLPEQARFLAGDLFRAYTSGVELEEIWDEVNVNLDVLFPVKGKAAEGGRFFSRANLELQRLTRDALEGIVEACFGDYHSNAMRNNRSYRRFYARIRRATDTRAIGELMKQAYEARQGGNLSVKHFIALNTVADNQRERLLSARLSATAYKLIDEIVSASEKKLGYLGWAMYGDNNPSHPIHELNSCEQTRVWEVWNGCKELLPLSQLNHLQLSAKMCANWGRALPVACFIFQAVAKDLFELPRLRKTIAIVLNRQSATTRKPSSASKSAVPTVGASAMKGDER